MNSERIFALLLLAAGSSAMAEWLPVSAGNDGTQTTYTGGKAITVSGHIVNMSSLQDFRTPQRIEESPEPMLYKSVEKQFAFDCANKQFRMTSFAYYAGNMGIGRVVLGDSHTGSSGWQPVNDDPMDKILFARACTKK
ncbi:MAG: surface-adhesin E family protein [Gallionella sp.]